MPTVGQNAVLQIFLLEECHVDERHTAGVKGKHEKVTGKVHVGSERQVEVPYLSDYFQRYSALDGFVDTRIDMPERIALYGKLLLHSAVVYCPQVTHIEGYAVGAYADGLEVALVCGHQRGIHIVQRNVPFLPEAREAVGGSGVGVGGASLPCLPELPDKVAGEREEATVDYRGEEPLYHVVGRVRLTGCARGARQHP